MIFSDRWRRGNCESSMTASRTNRPSQMISSDHLESLDIGLFSGTRGSLDLLSGREEGRFSAVEGRAGGGGGGGVGGGSRGVSRWRRFVLRCSKTANSSIFNGNFCCISTSHPVSVDTQFFKTYFLRTKSSRSLLGISGATLNGIFAPQYLPNQRVQWKGTVRFCTSITP
jgi:hypothetical protein